MADEGGASEGGSSRNSPEFGERIGSIETQLTQLTTLITSLVSQQGEGGESSASVAAPGGSGPERPGRIFAMLPAGLLGVRVAPKA